MIVSSNRDDTALRRLGGSLRWHLQRLPQRAVESGVPPAWLGWRWVVHDTVPEYLARTRTRNGTGAARYETIHPETVVSNPLPRNIGTREDLPAESGWWGYSFRDVPERTSGDTFIATLPDCRLVSYIESRKNNFYPGILNRDQRGIRLREIVFRPGHGRALRASGPAVRLDKATWILERVYHNHSHWLTAHLPKLCLLKSRDALDDLILPRRRSAAIDASLRMLGLNPGEFRTYDPDRPLEVDQLTVLGTDRFRPELLQPVRSALAIPSSAPPWRRILISRARSKGRRLLDEETVWPVLRAAGFERVLMEELSLEDQVRLMGETAILLAPHGAGLTNMMFCPPGTHVVEIADLSFPNPNFYALACAMGHHYWLVQGEGVGDGELLDKDLRVGTAAIRHVLNRIES